MIFSQLDLAAEQAAARYALLTDGWRMAYLQALNASNFGSAQQAQQLVAGAYETASTFLVEERIIVKRTIEEIAREALQTTLSEIESIAATELTPRALEHLQATEQYLDDEIIAQVHRDIAMLRQTLQRAVLAVSLKSRSTGVTLRRAQTEFRLANADELEFVFFDRAARKWQAKKFIRTIWRMTLLAVYNETVLLTLADHGLDTAQVTFLQGGTWMRGQVISIAGAADQSSYDDIRADVFQPNANAVLAMEMADVL